MQVSGIAKRKIVSHRHAAGEWYTARDGALKIPASLLSCERSMPYFNFIWTDEIIAHLAEHDITPDDFEHVVTNPKRTGKSKSSGDPAAWGVF